MPRPQTRISYKQVTGQNQQQNIFPQPDLRSQIVLFVSLFVNVNVLSYQFSALNIFQGFSLSFAKTLGRAVDKLLNGSRVTSPYWGILAGKLPPWWGSVGKPMLFPNLVQIFYFFSVQIQLKQKPNMITDQNRDIIQLSKGYLYASQSQSTGWAEPLLNQAL